MLFRGSSENSFISPKEIQKFHIEASENFEERKIKKVCNDLLTSLHKIKIVATSHFKERCQQKHIPEIPVWKFLKWGKCFEYKLVNKQLYRLALRLTGKLKDYIVVIQPQYNRKKLELVIVTCYANSKGDNHASLNKSAYNN